MAPLFDANDPKYTFYYVDNPGNNDNARLKTLKVTEPPKRSAGIKVADVDELVARLKEMAI